MELKEILLSGSGIVAVVLTLVQLSPIKINPWSSLAKWIGNAFAADLIKGLDDVKADVKTLKERDAKQDAQRLEDKALDARRRILQFGDECRRGVKHSQEHFNNIFEDINFYRKYCKEHSDFENDKAALTIKRIDDVYQKCVDQNDFL